MPISAAHMPTSVGHDSSDPIREYNDKVEHLTVADGCHRGGCAWRSARRLSFVGMSHQVDFGRSHAQNDGNWVTASSRLDGVGINVSDALRLTG